MRKLLGPMVTAKKNYANELFVQMLPSAAAFVIEHPEKAEDDVEVYLAAIEGVLRTHDSILRVSRRRSGPFWTN